MSREVERNISAMAIATPVGGGNKARDAIHPVRAMISQARKNSATARTVARQWRRSAAAARTLAAPLFVARVATAPPDVTASADGDSGRPHVAQKPRLDNGAEIGPWRLRPGLARRFGPVGLLHPDTQERRCERGSEDERWPDGANGFGVEFGVFLYNRLCLCGVARDKITRSYKRADHPGDLGSLRFDLLGAHGEHVQFRVDSSIRKRHH